jgi:hypothetical protein
VEGYKLLGCRQAVLKNAVLATMKQLPYVMSLSKSEKCSRVVMLALGLSCVISGVYFVTQSLTDSRALLISQYSAAIRAFSIEHFPFFSALDVDIVCDGQHHTRLLKRQEQISGLCRDSVCDTRSDIPSYLSLVYVLANVSRDVVNCQLAVTPSSVPAPPLQSLLPLPAAPLNKQIDVHLNSKMCNNRGGTYRDGTCWVQGWLESGCMTISGTSAANLSLGGVVPSGVACDLINSLKSAPAWRYLEFHRPSFAPSLTLRSFKDPYVAAQIISDFTMDFGSTPKDNYSTGVVLLSLGGALLLPQMCMCAFRLRSWLQERSRRRYHANLQSAAECDSPSDSPAALRSASGSRNTLELQPVHRAAGGTMVDLSSLNRRPSPKPKSALANVSAANNV